MSKYTFVVEFEDGKEPGVGFGTKILGGKLCMVADMALTSSRVEWQLR